MATGRAIGIAGGSGSGKSHIAAAVKNKLGDRGAILPLDSYYRDLPGLSDEEKAQTNFDAPESLDIELFSSHLRELKDGRPIERPVYDFSTHSRTGETVEIGPCEVVIADGILLLAVEEIRCELDLAVFMAAPGDVRLSRRIKRDTELRGRSEKSVREQFINTVKPMHDLWVEPSRRRANLEINDYLIDADKAADSVLYLFGALYYDDSSRSS